MPSFAVSTANVPLTPTWPPSGHEADPLIGSTSAITRRASTWDGEVKAASGRPNETPNRNESAEVIDWTCAVDKSPPGRVVESLQAAVRAIATIAAHEIHFLCVMSLRFK